MITCHILDTGYCLALESHAFRGGRQRLIACHGLAALLEHPSQGWLLWDTGYAPHILAATRRLPYRIYRWLTPLRLRPELAVARQLTRYGLRSSDIRRVLISHFHADHIAGLRDFPASELIASAPAYADIVGRRGLRAVRRGFVPALLPDDFASRLTLLPPFAGPPLPGLGPTHDLFDDGLLQVVELPGHACGQIGLLAKTCQGSLLFAADGAWHSRAIRELRPPHPIANLLVDDPRAVAKTLARLQIFAQARPDVLIVPTHCPELFQQLFG